MSFKDKPKRDAGKTFGRDTKKTTAGKRPDGKAKRPDGGDKRPEGKAKRPEGAQKTFEAAARAPRKPAAQAVAAEPASEGKPERISKILARAGVASRRDVERMIMDGRVRLNGQLLDTPVVNATLADKIEVDGEPIRGIERTRLWLYHKPAGLVTTNADPEGRPTVFDNLPGELPRVMSVGRLDINTEGLLLLTNDGGLSRVLELPTTGWLRRYRVRAHGDVSQEDLDKLKDGIAVDGILYGAIDATLDRTQGHNVWITMGLREGKNREIKNVLGALGLEVNRLIRISYGPFQLGDLPEGHVVEVRGRMLRDQLGPRLIEESKANFDAPIYSSGPADDEAPQPKAAGGRRDEGGWGAEERQERPKGRLDTRPERDGEGRDGGRDRPRGKDQGRDQDRGGKDFAKRGGKPGEGKFGDGKFGDDKAKKRLPLGTSRTANVWMAPGARPTADGGTKKSARAEAERLFNKGGEPERRTSSIPINRVEGDSDWIRAEAPVRRPRDEDQEGSGRRDRGDRGDRGDRPARGDRSDRGGRGDRPARGDRSERPASDRPRADRRPREDGDRPRSKPYGSGSGPGRSPREAAERAFSRPSGERSYGDRSSGNRSDEARSEGGRGGFGERPSGGRPGAKPFGSKPFGAKPSGGKPSGGKPSGGKPSGATPGKGFGGKGFGGKGSGGKSEGRPSGGSPSGGRPFGGKPSGGRGPGSGSGSRGGGGSRSRTPRG
ncbi:pseudouridine synthase [Rhizobium sp. SSA_523]|uniref:pseudouridine synthase n=1 Tax=Rhizobium sp. SSA_523 TaxID=2952477 RepID=UPI0020902538|nr:pseudouridine synthase [Rhizobium sp. SSA_523]MCO5733189.1 pseudouridine synthase [Rhizobium sp. SSA_523]WKC24059.1 pseudouridine synthase [Rhizobium sp. SSA_523]